MFVFELVVKLSLISDSFVLVQVVEVYAGSDGELLEQVGC
jgi:hypothetical protein